MARHEVVNLTADTWGELTDADVTTITFFNKSKYEVLVAVTTGAAPSNADMAIPYAPDAGEFGMALASFAPGIAGVRVWAVSPYGDAKVGVSHA